MEARYYIAPKNCMEKEDVLAYVRLKPLLPLLDVRYASLMRVWFLLFFVSGQKKRSYDSKPEL